MENYDVKWRGRLSEPDIAAWQKEEVEATRILVRFRGKDFEIFNAQDPKEDLFKWLFEKEHAQRPMPQPVGTQDTKQSTAQESAAPKQENI
jgi:hypothetical protein